MLHSLRFCRRLPLSSAKRTGAKPRSFRLSINPRTVKMRSRSYENFPLYCPAFRLLKYFFLFLGGYLGIFGIVIGVYLTVSHLAGLLSFGVPYLSPFVRQSTDNGTGSKIVRVPFKKRWRRPSYARQNERVRLQKIRDKNRKDR